MIEDKSLFEHLKTLEIIPPQKLEEAYLDSQARGILLETALIDGDYIASETIGKIVADFYNLSFVDLSQTNISPAALNIIPQSIAEKKKIIAFKEDDSVHLASTFIDSQLEQFLHIKTGKPIKWHHATQFDLQNALGIYQEKVTEVFSDLLKKHQEFEANKTQDLPIIEIVDALIKDAHQAQASDIHIEPSGEKAMVRYRIDGIMHEILSIPVSLHQQIVTRIKVMADLRTDEQQATQDGKINYTFQNDKLDIRVSIVPITDGENIVLRLLSESSRQFSLISLGLADQDLTKIQAAYQKPHGMLLVTGPTGSGKTTTMYAILKLLNKSSINIMTIEDPVEYDIEKVQQIQVNPKTNITFANGLRSIVRQDPDVILVGEIRDDDTADIAINAAMTGHLLLSTLHTNDAATALPRLIDMNIEPYLIASTVNVIVAQRLVRKICPSCRVSYHASKHEAQSLGLPKNTETSLYKGKGCDVCHQTGYNGRVGIFEVMEITPEIRQAIVEKKDAGEIHNLALSQGMISMAQDGYEKVKQGITTIEEVLRVTKD